MMSSKRLRCTVCGKLRDVKFLKRIGVSNVCWSEVGYGKEVISLSNGVGYSFTKCEKSFIDTEFYRLEKKIESVKELKKLLFSRGAVLYYEEKKETSGVSNLLQ